MRPSATTWNLRSWVGKPSGVVHFQPLSQHCYYGHDLLAVYLVAAAHVSVLLGLESHETVEGCGLDRFAIPREENLRSWVLPCTWR